MWFVDRWPEANNFFFGRYSASSDEHVEEILVALEQDARALIGAAGQRATQASARTAFTTSDGATLALIEKRAGQGKFRDSTLILFGGRCVVSGCDTEAVLEAAHIVPWSASRQQDASRALLLRADLHTLFDRGLLTLTRHRGVARVAVAPELRTSHYASLERALVGARFMRESHWEALKERRQQNQGGR